MSDKVIRATNGRWYAKFNGALSATASLTEAKANQHLQKLQRGLVKFLPLSEAGSPHKANDGLSCGRFNGATLGTRSFFIRNN